jgi:GTP-binding protein
MAGTDQRNPADDFLHLRKELQLHREELVETPYLVLANKMDAPESAEHLAKFIKQTGEKVYEISAKEGTGLEPVKEALYTHFFKK